ncbi:unnamed protein product [Lathyrus oleraceus]
MATTNSLFGQAFESNGTSKDEDDLKARNTNKIKNNGKQIMIEGEASQQSSHGDNSEKWTYKEMVMRNNYITIVDEAESKGEGGRNGDGSVRSGEHKGGRTR